MFDKQRRIEELKKQVYKLKHPAISEEEKNKGIEKIFQKIQKVNEE